MPGRRCAVFGCNNSRVSTKAKAENIIYHNFPKENDLIYTAIRDEWIWRCKRADKWNPNTSQICSVHFTKVDYERDLQNELLGLPIRRILKKIAIPTLNLPDRKLESQSKITPRDQRLLKRKQKQAINDMMNIQPSTSGVDADVKPSVLEVVHEIKLEPAENDSNDSLNGELSYSELLTKYNTLNDDYMFLRQNSKRKVKLLNDRLNYYKKKCLKLLKNRKTSRL